MIIEARVEEIFDLVLQEIKRSGYDGLLPAGVVLTGGSQPAAGHCARWPARCWGCRCAWPSRKTCLA